MRLLLALVLVAALLSSASAAAGLTPRQDEFTPITESVVAKPWPVKGSDGRYHVVYEVELTNASSLPWIVQRVAVRNRAGRKPIVASWSSGGVRRVLQLLGSGRPASDLQPGQSALLFLTFSKPRLRDFPSGLVHQLALVNGRPSAGGPRTLSETAGATAVDRRRPVELGPPLQGSRWVAADGCCTAPRHVRAAQPIDGRLFNAQRFAIDFERLDEHGRLWTGDKRVLTNWAGYGQNVLAVANGTIVRAIDGRPQAVPGALPADISVREADGNAVFLRLANGLVVLYAHLMPGSVTVRRGEHVRRGQVLGRVGNSGNSSAPHLHLQVVDRDASLAANGLPFTFKRFTVTGRIASTDAFNRAEENGTPARLGRVRTGARHDELSLDQLILTWP